MSAHDFVPLEVLRYRGGQVDRLNEVRRQKAKVTLTAINCSSRLCAQQFLLFFMLFFSYRCETD